MRDNDTIAAIATAHGRSAIGIIRISGPGVEDILHEHVPSIRPRNATLVDFCNGKHEKIDSVIMIYYKSPHSYTGEDLLEIQTHGNPIILVKILNIICAKYARQARAGEFTERAFLNNKIDLLQAEATIDLINSSSIAAANSAMKSLSGAYSKQVSEIKSDIIKTRSSIEAIINFPEDETTSLDQKHIGKEFEMIVEKIKELLSITEKGIKLNENAEVVIVGEPNSGKSTLCNGLLKEEKIIVTEYPGTTRDVIRYDLKVGDNIISLTDTAGIRQTNDKAEAQGVKNALRSVLDASLILCVMDINEANHEAQAQSILGMINFKDKEIWKIYNKIDLSPNEYNTDDSSDDTRFFISAQNGNGLLKLEKALAALSTPDDENVGTARKRHQQKLGEVLENLYNASKYNERQKLDIVAQELAIAHKKLDEITGGDYNDEVLESIFSEFCIGK